MTTDELREIVNFLRERVSIEQAGETGNIKISFNTPSEKEMTTAGLNADGVKKILNAPWWEEMVTDVIETPDFCEPDEEPDQVLKMARDVVNEYFGKKL